MRYRDESSSEASQNVVNSLHAVILLVGVSCFALNRCLLKNKRRKWDEVAYQPINSIMTVFNPSASLTDENSAWMASSTASRRSSSMLLSETLTKEFKITVNRLLKAFPATVTRDANARALKTDIGIAVNVGIKTGKTVEART